MLMLQYYKADDYYSRREIGSLYHYPGLTKIYGEGTISLPKIEETHYADATSDYSYIEVAIYDERGFRHVIFVIVNMDYSTSMDISADSGWMCIESSECHTHTVQNLHYADSSDGYTLVKKDLKCGTK